MKSLNKLKYYQIVIEDTINVGLHAAGFKEKNIQNMKNKYKMMNVF